MQTKRTVPIEKISGGRDFGSLSQVLKAAGAEASKIKKVQKQEIGKPLSKAMQQWVQANRFKLKNPTAKQEAIFKKYDQMKKAGMLAAKPAAAKKDTATKFADKPKKGSSTTSTPVPQKPRQQTTSTPAPTKSKASDKAVKGGYTISPEKRKAGTRGAAEQPKPKTKPRRGSGVKKTGKTGKKVRDLIKGATNFARTVGSFKKVTGRDGKPKAVINGNLYNIDPKTGRVGSLYGKNFK